MGGEGEPEQAERADDAAENTYPFVAPSHQLPCSAPLGWLSQGWNDYKRAWPQSLAYGVFMALASVLVSALSWRYGSALFLLSMLGGFVFLMPLLCIGLYALSAQLERGQPASLRTALHTSFRRHLDNGLVFALVLIVVFLVWARVGAVMSIFLPEQSDPPLSDLITYYSIGTAVGAVFTAVAFSASAFSLPMVVDRRVDMITAVITSVNAVLRNKKVMVLWLGCIVAALLLGVLTAFVGLAVTMPVIGHAAWHGYHATIDASGFPRHQTGVTASPRRPVAPTA
ncbi:MAG: DUF2189 domain-containing protein [Pseudomonadota bacterium]